jgi:hypothetical protein
MKLFDLLSSVRVLVPAIEVEAFKRKYPGTQLPSKPISFIFNKKNMDVEDVYPQNIDGTDAEALMQEAKAFAEKNMKKAASIRASITARIDKIAEAIETESPEIALALDMISDRIEASSVNAGKLSRRINERGSDFNWIISQLKAGEARPNGIDVTHGDDYAVIVEVRGSQQVWYVRWELIPRSLQGLFRKNS